MKNKQGFTLIELIIYVTIVSVVMVAFVSFSNVILINKGKNNASIETYYNARLALQKITQEIRHASDINTGDSIFDTPLGQLSLQKNILEENPTIINVQDNALQIKYGSESAIPLTTGNIKVTELIFSNLTGNTGPQNIKIQLTVENSDAQGTFASSISLSSTVSIRQ